MSLNPVQSFRINPEARDIIHELAHVISTNDRLSENIIRSISNCSSQEKLRLIEIMKQKNPAALIKHLHNFDLTEIEQCSILYELLNVDIKLLSHISTRITRDVLVKLFISLVETSPSIISRYSSRNNPDEKRAWILIMEALICEDKELIAHFLTIADSTHIDPWVLKLLKTRPQLFSLDELCHLTSHRIVLQAIQNLISEYKKAPDAFLAQKIEIQLRHIFSSQAFAFLKKHPSICACIHDEKIAKACITYIQKEIPSCGDYIPDALNCYLFVLTQIGGRGLTKHLHPLIERHAALATEFFQHLLQDSVHLQARLTEVLQEPTVEMQARRIEEYLVLSKYTGNTTYDKIATSFETLSPHVLQNILVDTYRSTNISSSEKFLFSIEMRKECIYKLLQNAPGVLESVFLTLRQKGRKVAAQSMHSIAFDWLQFGHFPQKTPSHDELLISNEIAEAFLQKHPKLLIDFIDFFLPQPKETLDHWITILLEKCPILLVKNIHRMFPDVFSIIQAVPPPIHMEKLDEDKARMLWDTLCDIKDRVPQNPPWFLSIMHRCIEWIERATPEQTTALRSQPKHAKVSYILFDQISQNVPKDKKCPIEKLIKDKEFKKYREKKECLWSLFSLEEDALSMDKIINYLVDNQHIDANALVNKAQEVLTCLSIPEALDILKGLPSFTPEAFILPFIQKTMPVFGQDFWDKYQSTFATWSIPYAMIHYMLQIHSLQDEDKTTLFPACARYIDAVFAGNSAWRNLRRRPTLHTQMVEQHASTHLLETWHTGSAIDLQTACDIGRGDETESYSELLFSVLHTMLIVDRHIVNIEQKMPILSAYLETKSTPTVSIDTQDPFYETLETLCLELITDATPSRNDKLRCLQKIVAFLKTHEHTEKQFVQEMKDLLPCLEGESVSSHESRWTIHDTDAPDDLFLTPTVLGGSCQSVFGNPEYNKCLMGYVLDPKIRYLIIKDETGKPIARAIVKLMLRQVENQPMDPVLFLERVYPPIHSPHITPALVGMTQLKAKKLGIPLYLSKEVKEERQPNQAAVLHSFSSVEGLFEYSDAAALDGDAFAGVTNGTYSIRHA